MSINALAKLRDDKAVPDGVDVATHIGRAFPSVKPVQSGLEGTFDRHCERSEAIQRSVSNQRNVTLRSHLK